MTLTASSRWWMKSSLPTIELWCMQAPCEPCLCSLSVISIWDPRLQGEAFVMGLELLGPQGSPLPSILLAYRCRSLRVPTSRPASLA